MIPIQSTYWIAVPMALQSKTHTGPLFFQLRLGKILLGKFIDLLQSNFRIRLPTVLFRRLQQGTLALSNVSPRLSDPSMNVVIIPGALYFELNLYEKLRNRWQRCSHIICSGKSSEEGRVPFCYSRRFVARVTCFTCAFTDNIQRLSAVAPFMFTDGSVDRGERFASDVGCLNLT